MKELAVVDKDKGGDWRRPKARLLDSVSSQEPRPGLTKAAVTAWRVALEARGLGDRKLAVETADNGL